MATSHSRRNVFGMSPTTMFLFELNSQFYHDRVFLHVDLRGDKRLSSNGRSKAAAEIVARCSAQKFPFTSRPISLDLRVATEIHLIRAKFFLKDAN